jgi:transcriptional regulator with XRE-family HTH domain
VQEKSSLIFSERFSRAIARAGMKQARISEITGISKGYLSELLSGKKPGPSPEAGKKLAEVLGVSPEWLMFGDQMSFGANAQSSGFPKETGVGENANTSYVLKEEATPYRANVDPVAAAFAKIREGLDLLEQLMKNPPQS